jgi:hypothetical protein
MNIGENGERKGKDCTERRMRIGEIGKRKIGGKGREEEEKGILEMIVWNIGKI